MCAIKTNLIAQAFRFGKLKTGPPAVSLIHPFLLATYAMYTRMFY